MADPRDDRVSAAYRELPSEGPPALLDAAIQAAARRAVGARPGGARRWQVPVSIAAVLALAIGISLHVEREKPVVVDGTPVSPGSAEYPVPQAAPEKEDRAIAAPAPAQAPAAAAPAPALGKSQKPAANEVAPATRMPVAPLPETKRFAPDPVRAEPTAVAPMESRPAPIQAPPAPAAAPASPPVASPAPPPASAPQPAAAGATASGEAMRAAPQAAKRAKSELAREHTLQEKTMSDAMETPQRRLERIADLRAKGLHEEADRQLAEFRRAYPDYRIPEEWLRRVQRQ